MPHCTHTSNPVSQHYQRTADCGPLASGCPPRRSLSRSIFYHLAVGHTQRQLLPCSENGRSPLCAPAAPAEAPNGAAVQTHLSGGDNGSIPAPPLPPIWTPHQIAALPQPTRLNEAPAGIGSPGVSAPHTRTPASCCLRRCRPPSCGPPLAPSPCPTGHICSLGGQPLPPLPLGGQIRCGGSQQQHQSHHQHQSLVAAAGATCGPSAHTRRVRLHSSPVPLLTTCCCTPPLTFTCRLPWQPGNLLMLLALYQVGGWAHAWWGAPRTRPPPMRAHGQPNSTTTSPSPSIYALM